VYVSRAVSDPVALLQRFIRVPTQNPGGDERALADLLRDELRARRPDEVLVADVAREDGAGRGAYVYARWGTPRLVVNAHIDTVPPNEGWTGDPHAPRVQEGRIYGLGACDTKGAIAALLSALDDERPGALGVLFSGDEEKGGSCVRAFLASEQARGLTQAVVCEPTGLRAGTRHRGVMALEARLKGHGGHSSLADTMPAPLADLARLAIAWDDWGRARRSDGPPGFPGMCFNVARLDGGVAFNVVPEEARLTVSLRPPPGADARAIREELYAIAARTAPGAEVTAVLDNAPFQTRDAASFAPWLGRHVQAPADLPFWTEAALFSGAGIDAAVFGPGDVAQAHAPDEFVSIAELHNAREAFTRLIRGTK
jgi:acetylornithine deacetylase